MSDILIGFGIKNNEDFADILNGWSWFLIYSNVSRYYIQYYILYYILML